jgi:hypothetical protein
MEATEQFVDLVTRAHDYVTQRQDALYAEFRIDAWPRFDWDQDTGQLVFSSDGVPRVIADIQFVGSVSTETHTWLWAWDNEHVDAPMSRDVREVRAFGEAHGIAQLTTPKWEADEVDGWEMTSISAYILQAKGVYRTPDGTVLTYLVFTSMRWADGADPLALS